MVAAQNVDVDRAGAGIEQHDHLLGLEAIIDLEGVLQRERVDVDDDRHAPGLRDDAGVVGDLFFLRGDEEHVHRPLLLAGGAGVENLVIEVDVLDVERNVLFRFPVDRLGELGLGHHRQADLLDDHGVARERRGDFLRLERFVLEEPPDGVGDGGAVDDGAVDNAVGGNRLDRKGDDLEAFARSFQLNSFNGARPDVEADD